MFVFIDWAVIVVKNRLVTLLLAGIVSLGALAGCSKAESMNEEWCEAMMEKPNAEWVEKDAQVFARDCLYNNQENE